MFEDRITEEKTGREFKIHGWFLGKPTIGYFNLSLNTDGTYSLHKYLQIPPLQTWRNKENAIQKDIKYRNF